MTFAVATTLIWYCSTAAMIAVVIAMAGRKLFSVFPAFGAFALFEVLSGIVIRWVFYHRPIQVYFYSYWTTQLIEALLTLLCIQELFRILLQPYSGLRVVSRSLFWIGSGVLIPVCLWMLMVTPPSYFAKVSTQLVSAQRSFGFLQLGLVLLLLIFCRVFSLHWTPYALGITLGFGISACATSVLASFRVQNTEAYFHLYYIGAPLSFTIGALVWSFCVSRDARSLRYVELPTSSQLARWNIALEELSAR